VHTLSCASDVTMCDSYCRGGESAVGSPVAACVLLAGGECFSRAQYLAVVARSVWDPFEAEAR